MDIILKAKNIKKKYQQIEVLKGIDIDIKKGELVSLVGSSGAGKSTLLHILGSLDTPDQGEVWVNGQSLTQLKKNHLASFRNKQMGFIFQFHHLLPEFTALENICLPGWIAGDSPNKLEKRALLLLNTLHINHIAQKKIGQMSGGEQQRVAIARALINEPTIIFADEPTGNLDSKNAEDLHLLFLMLSKHFQQSFLIATHNEHLAHQSDRIITMKDGILL